MQLHRIQRLALSLTLILAGITTANAAGHKPLYAKALAPGDTIMFVAPAKYLDKKRMSLARRRLEDMGFKVRTPDTLFRRKGFLAGSDRERADEIMAAFADPEVDAIFPGTGGYGTTRIVDKLDYDVIRRNPKIFIGFSDITALHIAINQRTGLITFHSPNPEYGIGDEKNLSPFADKWFWRAVLTKNYAALRGLDGNGSATTKISIEPSSSGYSLDIKPHNPARNDDATVFAEVPLPTTLSAGTTRGRLIGGNLSVIHALMGTPYEVETDEKILFLEDVGEAPYRVDRMLSTLRLAGKFERVTGVILGAFTARKEEPKWDDDASIDDVLREYFADLGVPVLADFPLGHVRYNATLPIGALVELDADSQSLRLLENPIIP